MKFLYKKWGDDSIDHPPCLKSGGGGYIPPKSTHKARQSFTCIICDNVHRWPFAQFNGHIKTIQQTFINSRWVVLHYPCEITAIDRSFIHCFKIGVTLSHTPAFCYKKGLITIGVKNVGCFFKIRRTSKMIFMFLRRNSIVIGTLFRLHCVHWTALFPKPWYQTYLAVKLRTLHVHLCHV